MNMDVLYKESEWCMEFSNQEIIDYFVSPLKDKQNVSIKILSEDEEVPEYTDKKIDIVCLDGDKEELYISFLGCQTSIFVKNEELMFIDENAKSNYTTSDTKYNVVYEGNLRTLTHKEILGLLVDVINCFIGASDIDIYEEAVESNFTYQKCNYRIEVATDLVEKKTKIYHNICIHLK
ncbi:hypothetical protein [Brevibacillus agri]|uniref:hypothetical protein n=1 Tax=Brevibacillus agri TaxID=51101 RepID=UPI003D713E42